MDDDLPHYCIHPHNAGMFLTGVVLTLFINGIVLSEAGHDGASNGSFVMMGLILVGGTIYAMAVGF